LSYLLEIADTVQEVADAIAAILKVEVEIIDSDQYRVGGTGSVRKLGPKQRWGYVNKYVIKTGQHFILTNPGSHQICKVCELRNNCYCKVGIFCPINYEGKCIGIINLMGFDEQQQKTLINNTENYMEFIMHMASLLSSKVAAKQVMKKLLYTKGQLDVIVNNLPYGIIAVDEDENITCFNQQAGKLLEMNPSEVIGKPAKEILPQSSFTEVIKSGKKILNMTKEHQIGNIKKTLLCSTYPIISLGKIIGAIESFQDYGEAQIQAQRLTEHDLIYTFDDIISVSSIMEEVKEQAKRAAQGIFNILIEGESGTGKELFARAIHAASPFNKGPFIAVNCSAIPESLLESELFGYESGAFTGAKAGGKPGKFELANGGTLFLDEVGEIPLHLQAKLLRVLQERVVERIGSTTARPINVRIVAATNRNLLKMVQNGEFRDDLYYRLNVIPITIPPLRERIEDIPVLLDYLLKRYSKIMKKQIAGFTSEACQLLCDYTWPGNVRELENAVQYAISFAEDQLIHLENIPPYIRERSNRHKNKPTTLQEKNLMNEKKIIEDLLQKYGTSVAGKDKVAEVLGISRATLYRKIKKLGLNNPEEKTKTT